MTSEYGSPKAVDEALRLRNRARIVRSFVKSSEGQHIIKGIQEEVQYLMDELINTKLEHDTYVEKRAQIAVLRKLLSTWSTDAENVDRYNAIYEQKARENAEKLRLEQAGQN